ncbi:MAG: hypothetical protein IPO25_21730 [Saprospiraceae bacterium]|nr:hypothetical protein [Saprospiraceae bacterium]
MGSDIVVDIKYYTTNTVAGENNEELMHFVVTVVPGKSKHNIWVGTNY